MPAATAHGLSPYRADRETEPGSVTEQTFRSLLASAVVVCDLTGLSPNVLYELGVVHASNLPVVLLIDDAQKLPFYAKDQRVIRTGSGTTADYDRAREQLNSVLDTVLSPTYRPSSIVGEVLGLMGPFPPALRLAIYRGSRPLYREAVSYSLTVRSVRDHELDMRFGLKYRLVNRMRNSYTQIVGLVPMRPFDPVYGRIGRTELEIDAPEHRTERGWLVPHEFGASSTTDVEFVADVRYRLPDSDLYATYLPATDFQLRVDYPAESLRVVAEPLLATTFERERVSDGVLIFRPAGALRAYEGFKLDWLAR
ncbi:MAG: hypothetical protein ACR2QA_16830 [Solirubrobacteraceae bacterium]